MEKYQSYKSSGVEWIGEIPTNWKITKFKYVSKLYTGNSLNDEQKILYESDDENDIPYVSTKDIDLNTRSVNYNNGLRIPREKIPFKISPKDSFLLCVEGGSSGRKIVYLDRDVCFVNKLCSFKSFENTRFQYYFIQSYNFQDKFKFSLTGLIGGVSISTLRDFELVLPSFQEQTKIVQFLDEKTELIDKLISIKEQKLNLLEEKRSIIINQCVTKGLNPNVDLKDSGLVSIGRIPVKWDVYKLSRFTNEHRQGYYSNDGYDNDGYRVVRITDLVDNNKIIIENSPFYKLDKENEERYKLEKGDFLFQRTGSHKKIGVFDSDEPSIYGSFLIRFRFSNKINHKFLLYFFNSISYQNQLNEQIHGGVNPNIHVENIKVCYLTYPSLFEQNEIVKYLDSKTNEIDDLVQLEQKKIDLLKEYRQSLISEVVTGKIKVTSDE